MFRSISFACLLCKLACLFRICVWVIKKKKGKQKEGPCYGETEEGGDVQSLHKLNISNRNLAWTNFNFLKRKEQQDSEEIRHKTPKKQDIKPSLSRLWRTNFYIEISQVTTPTISCSLPRYQDIHSSKTTSRLQDFIEV